MSDPLQIHPYVCPPEPEQFEKSLALRGALVSMSLQAKAVSAEAEAQERYYACAHAVGISEGTARAILEQLDALGRPVRAEGDYDEARDHLYAGTMPAMAFERSLAQRLDMIPRDLEGLLLRLQTAMTPRAD